MWRWWGIASVRVHRSRLWKWYKRSERSDTTIGYSPGWGTLGSTSNSTANFNLTGTFYAGSFVFQPHLVEFSGTSFIWLPGFIPTELSHNWFGATYTIDGGPPTQEYLWGDMTLGNLELGQMKCFLDFDFMIEGSSRTFHRSLGCTWFQPICTWWGSFSTSTRLIQRCTACRRVDPFSKLTRFNYFRNLSVKAWQTQFSNMQKTLNRMH